MDHACFISYRHIPDELAAKSVEQLIKQIRSEINLSIAPGGDLCFVDEHAIGIGGLIDKNIASALCSSACMVVIFTPHYLDAEESLYCAKEYFAMEEIERLRMEADPDANINERGLILTIVLRGEEDLPQEFKKRKYLNFSRYASVEIFNSASAENSYRDELDELVAYIKERYKTLKNSKVCDPDDKSCINCDGYALPQDDEVLSWLAKMDPILPPSMR